MLVFVELTEDVAWRAAGIPGTTSVPFSFSPWQAAQAISGRCENGWRWPLGAAHADGTTAALSAARYGERAVSLPWREEHRPYHGRWLRAGAAGCYRHGFYTAEAKAKRRMARAALVGLRAALTNIDASRRTAFHEAGHVVVSWAIPDELIRPLDVMTARNG